MPTCCIWRRESRAAPQARLVPVTVTPGSAGRAAGTIEIELGGVQVRVDASVDRSSKDERSFISGDLVFRRQHNQEIAGGHGRVSAAVHQGGIIVLDLPEAPICPTLRPRLASTSGIAE
jgi:hypothetical protein